ncbi:hypothetical protein ENBRE01_0205 [Enteropsectra breve]|nr:hypothetical protein ENBRE01_0205 [Enteropsectra breve]
MYNMIYDGYSTAAEKVFAEDDQYLNYDEYRALIDSSIPAEKPPRAYENSSSFNFPNYLYKNNSFISIEKILFNNSRGNILPATHKDNCCAAQVSNVEKIQMNGTEKSRVEFVASVFFRRTKNDFKINLLVHSDRRTTCMIKNIPNKYTSEMLLAFINKTHYGAFDFIYLRMDFRNRCNVGYAFINFTRPEYVRSFYTVINGMRWKNFCSEKIAELAYASIQGIEQLKRKFRNSIVMCEERGFRPKMFYTEGERKGQEKEEFE